MSCPPDSFVIAWLAKEKKLIALNGSGRAVSGATPQSMAAKSKDGRMPQHGIASATVPGAVDAWDALLRRAGTLSFKDVLEPAVQIADHGFAVSERIQYDWIYGAEVLAEGSTVALSRTVTTDSSGAYQIPGLPAGVYKLTATHSGFATRIFDGVELTLNRTLTFDLKMDVGTVRERVEVSSEIPLLDTSTSSSGATIVPQQIEEMPINGRNYLDLLQLVPGVAINRQADINSDNTTPVLGERANNTGFLIDGLPNQNELNGGAAAQFNQDTIAEFQVITTGYKAEFGHASGGVVNVITKSGGNTTHGVASVYHRNSAFDSSNISGTDAPYLLRWDYDLAAGGAICGGRAAGARRGDGRGDPPGAKANRDRSERDCPKKKMNSQS
jgi:outer membrane receptor protein involved in Fe transport